MKVNLFPYLSVADVFLKNQSVEEVPVEKTSRALEKRTACGTFHVAVAIAVDCVPASEVVDIRWGCH